MTALSTINFMMGLYQCSCDTGPIVFPGGGIMLEFTSDDYSCLLIITYNTWLVLNENPWDSHALRKKSNTMG